MQAALGIDAGAFADEAAQALVCGVWAARWYGLGGRAGLVAGLPVTTARPALARLFAGGLDAAVDAELDALERGLAGRDLAAALRGAPDPGVHFYPRFLAAYDPGQRRARGVYTTPDAAADYIVAAVHRALQVRLGLRLGLADASTWAQWAAARGVAVPEGAAPDGPVVRVLDPASGTGSFLVRVVEVVHRTMRAEFERRGEDPARAWPAYVRAGLLPRLHAQERGLAAFVLGQLRVAAALADTGFRAGADALRLRLGDTLAGPAAAAPTVVLGNPPYDRARRPAADEPHLWALIDDVRAAARATTIFSHHASLYNLYVYFWRWALRAALEGHARPGVVAFVSPRSWLAGPGFVGLRRVARALAPTLWVVDLGGEQGGADPEANIFEVDTPVAVVLAIRGAGPAARRDGEGVFHRVVAGATAADKLRALAAAASDPLAGPWRRAGDGAGEPLAPATGDDEWQAMPALADLLPWQQPGCKFGRLWPVAPHPSLLRARWARFVAADAAARAGLFGGGAGRSVHTQVRGAARLVDLAADAPPPPVVRYGHRSFDRQWALADPRLARTESPSLWTSQSPAQLYLTARMTGRMSAGPCLTVTAHVPDLHHFHGAFGGKDVLPLYRDAEARAANVTAGLLPALGAALGLPPPTPEELAGYLYALLSAPRYQQRFAEALRTPGPRVPVTRDAAAWIEAAALGRRLLWLHTFGERCRDPAAGRGGEIPAVPGLAWARPVTAIPASPARIEFAAHTGVLTVGDGRVRGVRAEVWAFAVSGAQVVRKWLAYRTARGAGRAAGSRNPLDAVRPTAWPPEWSDELLALLTVLDHTVALRPAQAALLDRICEGPRIAADELPRPAPAERREPRAAR